MKKLLVGLVAILVLVGAVVPVLAQTEEASACVPGYSPGYFKNHLDAWGPVDPYSYFDEVMRPPAAGYEKVGPHKTLIEVLWTGGGKFDALNRQAVAALINAYLQGSWYYSPWAIKVMVNRAYLTGDWSTAKALLEAVNSA